MCSLSLAVLAAFSLSSCVSIGLPGVISNKSYNMVMTTTTIATELADFIEEFPDYPGVDFGKDWIYKRSKRDEYKKLRLLCIVMRQPHQRHLVSHVQRTWGKGCDELVFISTMPEGTKKEEMWRYMLSVLRYVYKKYRPNIDWILKTNIDNYVAIRYLKKSIFNSHDPKDPVFFGCSGAHNYESFAISKRALALMSRLGSQRMFCFRENRKTESIDTCLKYINVKEEASGKCNSDETSSVHEFLNGAKYAPIDETVKYDHKKIFLNQVDVKTMYLIDSLLHQSQSDVTPRSVMVRSRIITVPLEEIKKSKEYTKYRGSNTSGKEYLKFNFIHKEI